MTWHEAIQHVLAEKGGPMHYAEITDRIVQLNLRSSYGATPGATVISHLGTSINKQGADSPYRKVASATYALRAIVENPKPTPYVDEVAEILSSDDVEDVGLIQAFGMYWQRDAVHWRNSPAILGRQHIGAETVDFSRQLGVYLLHDGREVTYVGRSIDRPMGQRLFEHTKDRLQARWNRFSWFGLLRVTEDGRLVETQATLSIELVAVTLEAVLIEGLEPRQNRRRGDGFNATEYLQAEDPEIQRRQTHQLLDSLKAKL
ncbi:HTH domain-containing protein [Botrimarina mediterranea]|nr:HTH domain-containing protein [Botrimarina mediterranea]